MPFLSRLKKSLPELRPRKYITEKTILCIHPYNPSQTSGNTVMLEEVQPYQVIQKYNVYTDLLKNRPSFSLAALDDPAPTSIP